MDLEQQIYEQKGMEEYLKYQIEHETEPFAPGPAFPFIKVQIKVFNHAQCCPLSFLQNIIKWFLSWFSKLNEEG